METKPMHEPSQLRSTSMIGVLDAAFRLYRAQFRALMIAVISVIGTFMMFLLLFQAWSQTPIDWTHLSPLRPEALVDAVQQLRLGMDPFDAAWDISNNLLFLLLAQTLLSGAVIGVVARGYLEPFHMTLPARPRGIRGEVPLVPGVLAALPLSILGAVIAHRLSIVMPLVWFRDEPLELEMIQFLWLTFGLELLVCLALAMLCVRLLLAAQVVVFERRGAFASLGRSWQLTRGAFGRMAAAAAIVTLVPGLLIGSLVLIPYFLFQAMAVIELFEPLLAITTLLGQALLALAYAFQLTFFTLLYYDLRFRKEGYDLELLAHRATVEQASTLVKRGAASLEREDLTAALADFEPARALLPDDRTILSYCISAKLRLDDPASALKDCEHAVALFPDDPHALHSRGLARYQLGDLSGAQADYDHALRLYPNLVPGLINRAHLKHTVGEYDSARQDLLWALQYNPGEPTPMYNIACGYARQNQADAALDWLGRAIAKDHRYRTMARDDADFAPLRDDLRFAALLNDTTDTQRRGDV